MIETIRLKDKKEGYVKYVLDSDLFNLIVDDREIFFFKIGDFILVNKFVFNKTIDKFDDERRDYYIKNCNSYDDDFRKIYGLFELDKTYLSFTSSGCSSSFFSHCFSKKKYNLERGFYDLEEEYCDEEIVYECDRNDLEIMFDYNNYDSMYIFNSYGNFLFVGNKSDGVIIRDKLVPTDDDLIKFDLRRRKMDAVRDGVNISDIKKINIRNIADINDVFVYGDNNCRYYIITSEDGNLNVNLFNLKYMGVDKYILKVRNIYNGMLKEERGKCKVKEK